MAQSQDPEETGALNDAAEWLQGTLAGGPLSANDVKERARDAGIAIATLRRAAQRLGIKSTKSGYQGTWVWALGRKVLKKFKDAQEKNVSTFGPDGHLWTAQAESHEVGTPGEAQFPGLDTVPYPD